MGLMAFPDPWALGPLGPHGPPWAPMGSHWLLRPPTGHTPPPKSYVGQTEVGHVGTRAKPDLNGAEALGPKIPRVFAPSLASTKLGKLGKMRAGGK